MSAKKKSASMAWHDLPKGMQVELSNLLPPRYHLDVIQDDPEALAEAVRHIRKSWQECEKILEKDGVRELVKERDRVAREREELERLAKQPGLRLNELRLVLPSELERHGEDGGRITSAEAAEVSEYAAHIVEEWKQCKKLIQGGQVIELDRQMHSARIHLTIVKEVLHRRDNFLPTQMPEIIKRPEETKENSKGHRWAIEIGTALERNYKRHGHYDYQPDRPAPPKVFYGSKETFKKWASEIISDAGDYPSPSKVYEVLKEERLYVKGNQGASSGLRLTIANLLRYARKHRSS